MGYATIFGKKIGCRPRGVLRFPFLGDACSIVFFRFIYRWRIFNSAAIFDKKIGCRPHGVLRFPFLGDARSVLFFRFIYRWRILGYVTTIFGKIEELLRLDN